MGVFDGIQMFAIKEQGSIFVKTSRLEFFNNSRGLRGFYFITPRCMVSEGTLHFYCFTSEVFIRWLEIQGIARFDQVNNRLVRVYLNELFEAGKKPNYINGHARSIRSFLCFCLDEKHILDEVKFTVPPTSKERLPYLTAEQVRQILDACSELHDKAMIMFMVDTGVRRQELISLNWGDFEIKSGLALVRRAKAVKAAALCWEPRQGACCSLTAGQLSMRMPPRSF